ncbi:MAG TPA: hypothetical protein PK616_03075 [Fibrobacteraceae bacterium]|nr:hypothetical protein [Fibrobacteraceae bacterium]
MAEEQDIINKYRGISSNDTEQKTEEPVEEQTQTPTEETETPEKKTVEGESVETPEEKNSEGEKEFKNNSSPYVERIIKDRLARQAKKHQRELEALRAELQSLKKKEEDPEFTRDDFIDEEEFERFKADKLKKSIKTDVMKEFESYQREREAERAQQEKVNATIANFLKTPEELQEWKSRLEDFEEDYSDFLESEQGQEMSSFMINSSVFPVMFDLIARNPSVVDKLSSLSTKEVYFNLKQLEDAILKKITGIKEAQQQENKNAEEQKPKRSLPNSGKFGGSSSSTSSRLDPNSKDFDAKEYLKRKYPNQY